MAHHHLTFLQIKFNFPDNYKRNSLGETIYAEMLEDIDPLSLSAYMRSRFREFLGLSDFEEMPPSEQRMSRVERPRGAVLPERLLEEALLSTDPWSLVAPDWSTASIASQVPKPRIETLPAPHGHLKHPSGQVDILDSPSTTSSRAPRRIFHMDVTESNNAYWLRADLAGFRKENVKISVDEDKKLVFIVANPPKDAFFGLYKFPAGSMEKQQEGEHEPSVKPEGSEKMAEEKAQQQENDPFLEKILPEKEVFHLNERCIHAMSRHIKMPDAVDFNAPIVAEMRDGLLLLCFRKLKNIHEPAHIRREIEIK